MRIEGVAILSVMIFSIFGFLAPYVPAAKAVSDPTFDGKCSSAATGASSFNCTISTASTNDVIIVTMYAVNTFGNTCPAHHVTVTGVSGASLTWQKRGQTGLASSCVDFETWWAPSAAVLTSQTITVTLNGTITASTGDVGILMIAAYKGVGNINSPFDPNSRMPYGTFVINQLAGTTFTAKANTTNPDDLLIGSCALLGSLNTLPTAVSPFSTYIQQLGLPPNLNGGGAVIYYQVSTPQNSTPDGCNLNGTPPNRFTVFLIIDALTADAAPVVVACNWFQLQCWWYPFFFFSTYACLIIPIAKAGEIDRRDFGWVFLDGFALVSLISVIMGMISIMVPMFLVGLGALVAIRS